MTTTHLNQNQISDIISPSSEHRSELSQAWRRFKANRMALIGLGLILLLCLMALLAEMIAPYDPLQDIFRGTGDVKLPSIDHPFGLDYVGRDLLTRIIYGTRVALLVGIASTLIAVFISIFVGSAAGYFGGWIDTVLSRLIDTLMAFPLIALLVVLATVLESGLWTTVIIIGASTWARYARVVRAETLSLRERDFVLAARATGVTDFRIILRHILPNILTPIIVLASLGIGSIIIFESALSFLGLGVSPETPSWGRILSDGRAHILRYPHIAIFPGVMITLTVLAFNFVGDGIRDALDPHE